MALVGIALGSNLGQRIKHLQAARKALEDLMPLNAPLLQAPIYQTAPMDCPEESPDFYNTVIEIAYSGNPEQLLQHTQAIEKQLGRTEKKRDNEPRIVDIDLLYFDDLTLNLPQLQIPHPRLIERRFVLEPLNDICPERYFSQYEMTAKELLDQLCSKEPPLQMVQANW